METECFVDFGILNLSPLVHFLQTWHTHSWGNRVQLANQPSNQMTKKSSTVAQIKVWLPSCQRSPRNWSSIKHLKVQPCVSFLHVLFIILSSPGGRHKAFSGAFCCWHFACLCSCLWASLFFHLTEKTIVWIIYDPGGATSVGQASGKKMQAFNWKLRLMVHFSSFILYQNFWNIC